MKEYIEQIIHNPEIFLSGILTDQADKSIKIPDEVESSFYDLFPYHSIICILRANGCESEIARIIETHSGRFAKEREYMCQLAGVEAVDTEGLSKLKQAFEKQLAEKEQKIKELEERINGQDPKSTRNGDLWFDESSKEIRFNGGSYKFIDVEGGTFWMGASPYDSDASEDEKPLHEVTLYGFAIGETPVTQALWKAVVEAWEKAQGKSSTLDKDPSCHKGVSRPVEYVSWDDCQLFIQMLCQLTGKNFSLPTEAEWEYAARGGNRSKEYKYSGGNHLDEVAWNEDNSGSETHPVKEKRFNELELYDMSGNVLEWCNDYYNSTYYTDSPTYNPSGPSAGAYRVCRGAGCCNAASDCRVSYRSYDLPDDRFGSLGFRLVLRP